jgi:hypothetical protein
VWLRKQPLAKLNYADDVSALLKKSLFAPVPLLVGTEALEAEPVANEPQTAVAEVTALFHQTALPGLQDQDSTVQ